MTVINDAAAERLVTAEQIVCIASDVWTSFLGMELVARPQDTTTPLEGPTMLACVHVSGSWEASVFLECTSQLAQAAAEAMFAAEPGSLSAEEVSDAVGELVNMIGGNIKGLLPGPAALSVPAVAPGQPRAVRLPDSTLVERVGLVCAAGPLLITVWKKALS